MSNSTIIRHVLNHYQHADAERRATAFEFLLREVAETMDSSPEEILLGALFDTLYDVCQTTGIPFTAPEDEDY